jgi:hypothetical protein
MYNFQKLNETSLHWKRLSENSVPLEACIFEIIALNQKNLLNLLTNFLHYFRIHKGPTSDIGTT